MHWGLLLTASAMLMLTMGVRQTTGLFMAPIHESTGIGIASISFALAIGQFVWGAVQPVFGAIADKHGPTQVLVAGGLMLALGSALTPFMSCVMWRCVILTPQELRRAVISAKTMILNRI